MMKRKVRNFERSEVSKWSLIARSILENVENRKTLLNLGDTFTSFTRSECIRAVSESIDESPARNLLLKCMLDAEHRSPGSSYAMLFFLSDPEFNCEYQFGRRFNLEHLRKSLTMFVGQEASDMVMDAILVSGRKGKIFVDSNRTQISEISYGTQVCKWKPDQSYFSAINQSKVSIENGRVIFVDGIIESVSECHKLFNDSYEKKVSIVVFARGFAEEVVATAAVNMQRRTAQIIPIVIPFDEVGVNGMADLANCFLSELISSDKGQLISNVDLESSSLVDRLSCTVTGTEIESRNNKVSDVIGKLTKRLGNENQDQSDLIRRRLEYLGSSSATIKIGNEKKSLRGIYADRVDFGVRYAMSCMKNGVLDINDVLMPFTSVKAGAECSKSFRNTIEKSMIVLEVDRCG